MYENLRGGPPFATTPGLIPVDGVYCNKNNRFFAWSLYIILVYGVRLNWVKIKDNLFDISLHANRFWEYIIWLSKRITCLWLSSHEKLIINSCGSCLLILVRGVLIKKKLCRLVILLLNMHYTLFINHGKLE